MLASQVGAAAVPLFDNPESESAATPSQVRLLPELWQRLTRIAGAETMVRKRKRLPRPSVSRNDVMEKVLTDFADAYEAANARLLAEYDAEQAAKAQAMVDTIAPVERMARTSLGQTMTPDEVKAARDALESVHRAHAAATKRQAEESAKRAASKPAPKRKK